MKQYFKLILLFFVYISCLMGGMPQITYANNSEPDLGYSYKIIKPENQIGTSGYFDLRMKPEQKQTVTVELYNMSDKEISVNVSLHSAKTNSNGVIEYGATKIKADPSLKYNIEDIAKVPAKVTIPPKGTEKVLVDITMPKEKYDGYIAGGIYLQKSETQAEKNAAASAKGVVNKYAFIIGLLLSETDVKVEPDLQFNKIYAGMINYRNTFLIDFSNIAATYVEGMTVDAQIFKKGSDEVLYEAKKENYRMAPNSSMTFPVNLNGELLVPGDYVGNILVTSGDKKWEWKEEFKVTQKDADKYNEEDVSLIQDRSINWKMITLIAGSILLALVVINLFVRKLLDRKKKAKRKKKKTASNKKR